MKVFVSGSKTWGKLNDDMKKKLKEFADAGYEILVGDCHGIDAAIQKYYSEIGYNNITVYVSGDMVRNNIGNNKVIHIPVDERITGYEFYKQKDIAMAKGADCGLVIWDEETKGTLNNIIDLSNQGKSVEVYSLIEKSLKTYGRKELLNLLFHMWKEKHCKDENCKNNFPKSSKGEEPDENEFKNSFCVDGFISDDSEKCEILFICRESNVGGNEEVNDYFWLKDIINKKDGEYVGDSPNCTEKRMQTKFRNYLKRITNYLSCNINNSSYMNINKRGGYATCNGERLNQYAKDYMDYILNEIRIINPQIVVFLGKDDSKDMYVETIKEKIKEFKFKCFHVNHPSSRMPYKDLIDDLEKQKGEK